jgi:hypothetical protein
MMVDKIKQATVVQLDNILKSMVDNEQQNYCSDDALKKHQVNCVVFRRNLELEKIFGQSVPVQIQLH